MSQNPTGIAQTDANTVRVAPLQYVPEVLATFGLRVEPLLGEVGLPAGALSDPESTLPVKTAARLLALCSERTGRPHFGLLAAQKVTPLSLGLIGMLALNSYDVGSALRGLLLTLHLNGRAVVPALVSRDGVAAFSLSLFGGYSTGAHEVADFTIAVARNLMRALCGPQWVPSEVLFSYRPPANQRPYSRFFNAPLRFNADRTALVFPAAWLAHRVPGASADARKALQQGIAAILSQQEFDLITKVRRALFAAIIQDDVSVESVARMIGMHRRTLNRRLAEQGTSIAGMLNEVRFQLARRLMSDTALSLVDIAATLNYTDASAFTRAFRSWAGVTPSAWRSRNVL
jgi:AraC-like DNA-binding protein